MELVMAPVASVASHRLVNNVLSPYAGAKAANVRCNQAISNWPTPTVAQLPEPLVQPLHLLGGR